MIEIRLVEKYKLCLFRTVLPSPGFSCGIGLLLHCCCWLKRPQELHFYPQTFPFIFFAHDWTGLEKQVLLRKPGNSGLGFCCFGVFFFFFLLEQIVKDRQLTITYSHHTYEPLQRFQAKLQKRSSNKHVLICLFIFGPYNSHTSIHSLIWWIFKWGK